MSFWVREETRCIQIIGIISHHKPLEVFSGNVDLSWPDLPKTIDISKPQDGFFLRKTLMWLSWRNTKKKRTKTTQNRGFQ